MIGIPKTANVASSWQTGLDALCTDGVTLRVVRDTVIRLHTGAGGLLAGTASRPGSPLVDDFVRLEAAAQSLRVAISACSLFAGTR